MPCSMKWKEPAMRFQRRAQSLVCFGGLDPARKSHTFRSGQTGGWREHFTDEHKKLFKDVAGDLLVRLGYEKNNEW